ncbi:MAG: hypothetical protein WEC79_02090 [Thermomicrobiales bacterium]
MHNWGREKRVDSTRDDGMDDEVPLPGVIDTIGFGYAALALRPLAILPIVALDLFLLFGPSVTLQPLTEAIASRLRGQGGSWSDWAAGIERLDRFSVFEAGTLGIPLLRTPGIVPSFAGERVEALRAGATWTGLPGGVVVLLLIAALAAGLLIASTYRSMLAQAALASQDRSLPVDAPALMGRAGRIAGWGLALAGLAILVAMPVIIATVAGAVFGFGEATLLWLFLLFPASWAWVHFFFSIHALVLDDAGPLEALRSSYQVVQRHFWQSLRFMAASLLISTGLAFALRELATSLPGALLAILLNAVIASGMIVAAMLFYRDRASRLGLHAQVPGR